MKLQGEQQISAPRNLVWEALNDPEVLQQCIPGCQSLEKTNDDGFEATVTMKVGPVKAKFKGAVTLSNIDAPNSYTITGEGKGGAAGFASGRADVTLEDAEGGTLLKYDVEAKVGGKLAQIGSRLVDGTAKKLAEEFFTKFGDVLSINKDEESVSADEQELSNEDSPLSDPEISSVNKGINPLVWALGLIAITGILIFVFSK